MEGIGHNSGATPEFIAKRDRLYGEFAGHEEAALRLGHQSAEEAWESGRALVALREHYGGKGVHSGFRHFVEVEKGHAHGSVNNRLLVADNVEKDRICLFDSIGALEVFARDERDRKAREVADERARIAREEAEEQRRLAAEAADEKSRIEAEKAAVKADREAKREEGVADKAVKATAARKKARARSEEREPASPSSGPVQGSGGDEWYTPAYIIHAARAAMGSIDLDPASSAAAQETVKADTWFDREADGLKQVWRGRTWINPPYNRGVIDEFADKLLESLGDGGVTECVWISNASFDTPWCQRLMKSASGICLKAERTKFTPGSGQDESTNAWATILLYFGPHQMQFKREFEYIGDVWTRRRDF